MTTLNDLVQVTKRRVLSDLREETDTLGANVSSGATTLSLGANQTLGSIRAATILEVDYELFLVTSQPSSPASIPVSPGFLGTTTAAHTAGALVTVNPRFPNADIVKAINEDLDDLSSPTNGLFQMLEVTVTYNPVKVGYDLTGVNPANVIEIHEIRVQDYGPAAAWPLLKPRSYKVQRNADPSVFPSKIALEMYDTGFPGRPMRIQYKAPYTTPLVNPTDDVLNVTGLHTQAHDIPELGAALRLMEYRELKRSFSESQGEPRRAQETPVGSSLTADKGIMLRRTARIEAERSRLNQMWPKQWR